MYKANVNLEDKAAKAIGQGKAIARSEGSTHLDGVHVLKAAIVVYREDVAMCLREIGCTPQPDVLKGMTTAEHLEAVEDRMSLTCELAAIMRKLRVGDQIITVRLLLGAILREPSVRVKALIHQVGAALPALSGSPKKIGLSPAYRSKRDRLADLHVEWRLRKAAVQACGLKTGFGDDYRGDCYSADSALDAVFRQVAINCSKAAATPTVLDPLAPIVKDLDEMQRVVCEGVLIDELYGLAIHPFGGVSVRDLAQLLSPETYPGNCRKVVKAVERLEEFGVVSRNDRDGLTKLTAQICLADDVLEQLLSDLEKDAISAGEFDEMKRKLRHGVEWDDGGVFPDQLGQRYT